MKISLNLLPFFLILFISQTLFSQPGEVRVESIERILFLEKNNAASDDYGKITTAHFIHTPFLMLSGYVEQEHFNAHFFFRTFQNRTWSDWKPFIENHEGETPGRTAYLGGEISPATEYVQIKTDAENPTKFIARFFAPGHSPKNQVAKLRSPEDLCACEQPPTMFRNNWCPSGNCPPDATPFPTTPTHIIVHHSAGQTVSSDYAAVVRSYWDLHVNTNGWDDIGYNWLVDPNGVLYEGRGENTQGAHFSGINGGTTGICYIGNYVATAPASAGLEMLKNFIAWEACTKDIDVEGAGIHASGNFLLNHVAGHLDAANSPNVQSSTLCPGDSLYALLPTLRSNVAAKPCYQEAFVNVNTLLPHENIDVFPNPSEGDFNIRLKNVEVKNMVIYNAVGQKVKQWNSNVLDSFSQNPTLKLESIGVYWVQFELKDKRLISRKLIVF